MAELEKKMASDYEFYRTFNAGIGMCVVCSPDFADEAVAIAKRHGMRAQVIGKIVKGSDVVLKKGGKEISLL